jgi:hypothetical protein
VFIKNNSTLCILLLNLILPVFSVSANDDTGFVVLLHGLARSDVSFNKMEKSLQQEGYITCNIAYPSTEYSIEKLASHFVLPDIKRCIRGEYKNINFVTHSMGGIVVRYLSTQKLPFKINRVVMLSPPNKGSEVVDVLGDLWLFQVINGPAGLQLSTSDDSLPNTLGVPEFELGIITGNQSINLILSSIIEGVDDGKVSIESAKLEGMKDFLVVEASHPFIMQNDTVIEQTKYFLKNKSFRHTEKD